MGIVTVDLGKVFDQEMLLEQIADGYRAMDECPSERTRHAERRSAVFTRQLRWSGRLSARRVGSGLALLSAPPLGYPGRREGA
jgi:hypothetical protein